MPPPFQTPSDSRRRPMVLQLVAYLLCPAIFVTFCWSTLLAPHLVASWLPHPQHSWLLGGPPAASKSVLSSPLLSIIKSPSKAWRLGYLAGQLQGKGVGDHTSERVLTEAAVLLRTSFEHLNASQILGLGPAIEALEHGKDHTARILATLNLVNLLWATAIVGVAVSIAPALIALSAPLRKLLTFVLQFATAAISRLVRALHPLWEFAAYAACAYIIGAGARYPSSYASLIAVTGCLLSIPSFLYSTRLHAPSSGPASPSRGLVTILNGFLVMVLTLVAIRYSSSLVGFLAAAALFGAVGFSVIPAGLCWHVGFGSNDAMLQASVTSAVVLSLLIILRAIGADDRLVAPFQLGLSTFGGISLFLAGLIRTSAFYSWHGFKRYFMANLLYFCLLMGAMAVGALLNVLPLQNTAITFLLLWVAEKLMEQTVSRYMWLSVFGASLSLWQVALFLRAHPEWLVSLTSW